MAIQYPQRYDDDFINTIKKLIDHVNEYGKAIQDLVADGQLTEEQYGNLISVINGHVKSGEIDKDDLNPVLKSELEDFDKQLAENATEINNKMDKNTADIAATQINKNLGKFDQTYMTDEFLQQITGDTPVNTVPPNKGVTTEKLADKAVTRDKTDFIKDSTNMLNNKEMIPGSFSSSDGGFIERDLYHISDFITVTPGSEYSTKNVYRIGRYDANKNFINEYYPDENGDTFNASLSTEFLRVVAKNEIYDKAQLNFGDTVLPFEPYYSGLIDTEKIEFKRNADDKIIVAGTKWHPTIQSAVNALPTSGGIVHVPEGDYVVSSPIKLRSNTTLQGAGIGSTKIFLAANSNCDVISNEDLINGNTNIHVKDLYIDGDGHNQGNTNTEQDVDDFMCGVRLNKCTHSTVENVHAHNVGWSVDWSARGRAFGILLRSCAYSKVIGCYGSECGYEGIGIRGYAGEPSYNITISDCFTYDNRQHGLQLTGGYETEQLYNVTINNLQTWGNEGGNGLIIGHVAHDVSVTGGIFTSPENLLAIRVFDGAFNVAITGASIHDSRIQVADDTTGGVTHNVTITGCTFRQREDLPGTVTGVHLNTEGKNIVVSANNVKAYRTPFIASSATFAVIKGNVLDAIALPASAGAIQVDGDYNVISNNTINNVRRGVYLRGSSDCLVVNNIIKGQGGRMIHAQVLDTRNPFRNIVNGNNVEISDSWQAIYLLDGDHNIVKNNIVKTPFETKIEVEGMENLISDNIELN